MAYCSGCGKKVEATWKVCPNCTQPLQNPTQSLSIQDCAVSGDIITTVNNKDFDRITLNLKTINTAKRIFLWLNSKKKSDYYRKYKNKKKLPVNKLNSKKMHLFILN